MALGEREAVDLTSLLSTALEAADVASAVVMGRACKFAGGNRRICALKVSRGVGAGLHFPSPRPPQRAAIPCRFCLRGAERDLGVAW